jgi:hypothetical protein
MAIGSVEPLYEPLRILRKKDRIREIEKYSAELEAQGRLTPAVEEAIARAKNTSLKYNVLLYIAGALTGVDEKTKLRYGQTSHMASKFNHPRAKMFGYAPHLYGTDPVKHPDLSPAEVRDIDYLWAVKVADCHIHFPYPIAHGSAIEEGWAWSLATLPTPRRRLRGFRQRPGERCTRKTES